jgi:hypothetical protein
MAVLTPIKREKTKPKKQGTTEPQKPFNGLWLLLLLGVGIFFATDFGDFVQKKSDGTYELSPEREADLERRVEEYRNAEQYALVATENDWYECFNCGDETVIFLYIGEVWKYGVSKHASKRYSRNWYLERNLQYITQFKGTIDKCLELELKKIYRYPLLPESLKRKRKLPRPPGNQEDY